MPDFDVVGLGNALVDVLSHQDQAFVDAHGLARGTMTLIDAERAEQLYGALGDPLQMSGGSAANTMVGVASFGGAAAFVGKVRDDGLGRHFRDDLRAAGVAYDCPLATDGPSTGRSMIVITPDADRTMSTYLGASSDMGPDHIDPGVVGAARITYLEGYLWDRPEAKEAYRKASRIAHEAGGEVALTLSDPFCVDRHRAEWRTLIDDEVDVLFGNGEELQSLYEVGTFDEAVTEALRHVKVAAITMGAKGSLIVSHGASHEVPAVPVDVVDTTGAGDLYAAGFLFGRTHGHDLVTCGRLGSAAASEVIGHTGARPQVPLSSLLPSVLA